MPVEGCSFIASNSRYRSFCRSFPLVALPYPRRRDGRSSDCYYSGLPTLVLARFPLRVLPKGETLMAPGSGSSRLCGAKTEVQGAVPFCRGGWQEEANSSEKMSWFIYWTSEEDLFSAKACSVGYKVLFCHTNLAWALWGCQDSTILLAWMVRPFREGLVSSHVLATPSQRPGLALAPQSSHSAFEC